MPELEPGAVELEVEEEGLDGLAALEEDGLVALDVEEDGADGFAALELEEVEEDGLVALEPIVLDSDEDGLAALELDSAIPRASSAAWKCLRAIESLPLLSARSAFFSSRSALRTLLP